jgi:ribosomal protein L37AE/L43A
MAKGNVCPNCGEQKFHRGEGAMRCTACGVRGWLTAPDSMGAGRGATCKFCHRAMMREVAELDTGTSVKYCYNCGATVIA